MQRIASYIRNRRGQSLVEMALLLPIVLWLVMGMIDFGMIIYNTVTLNEAARAGVRAAVVGVTDDEVRTRVIPNAVPILVDIDSPQIFANPADRQTGAEVTVIVKGSWPLITPLVAAMFENGEVLITGKATMRME